MSDEELKKYVYGYAWLDLTKKARRVFFYANSQEEADKLFESSTRIKLADIKSTLAQERRRA